MFDRYTSRGFAAFYELPVEGDTKINVGVSISDSSLEGFGL
jgi:hypothetical protein